MTAFLFIITWLMLLFGGTEAFLGFRQLYGFSVSNHSLYALTGSFYNPGPYMGYLAMLLPVCVYVSGCVFQHTHFIDGKTAVS